MDSELTARVARAAHDIVAAEIIEAAATRGPLLPSPAPSASAPRLQGGPPVDLLEQALDAEAQIVLARLQALRRARASDGDAEVARIAAEAMKALGIAATGGALLAIERAAADGAIEAWAEEHDRLCLVPRSLAAIENAALRARQLGFPLPAPAAPPAMVQCPRFSEAFGAFVKARKKSGRKAGNTAVGRVFVELMGDLRLDLVTREVLEEFLTLHERLPTDWEDPKKYASTSVPSPSLRDVIVAADRQGAPQLKSATLDTHRSMLRRFWLAVVESPAHEEPWHALIATRAWPVPRAARKSASRGAVMPAAPASSSAATSPAAAPPSPPPALAP